MTRAYVYNLKMVTLAAAILMGLMAQHKGEAVATYCGDCDQPDIRQSVEPALVKEPGIVPQYDFQGQDT